MGKCGHSSDKFEGYCMARPNIVLKRAWLGAILVASLLSTSFLPGVWADPVPPTARDRQIALMVSSLLKREHLTKHPFDQEITQRCLTQYLKMLDPLKIYFTQADVDGFTARQKDVEARTAGRHFPGAGYLQDVPRSRGRANQDCGRDVGFAHRFHRGRGDGHRPRRPAISQGRRRGAGPLAEADQVRLALAPRGPDRRPQEREEEWRRIG